MSLIKGIAMSIDYHMNKNKPDSREYPSEFSKRVTQSYEERCKVRLSQEAIYKADNWGKTLTEALETAKDKSDKELYKRIENDYSLER